jgi:predicted RecA/RadA family phage recombinase
VSIVVFEVVKDYRKTVALVVILSVASVMSGSSVYPGQVVVVANTSLSSRER